jgi:hypothetical protein
LFKKDKNKKRSRSSVLTERVKNKKRSRSSVLTEIYIIQARIIRALSELKGKISKLDEGLIPSSNCF